MSAFEESTSIHLSAFYSGFQFCPVCPQLKQTAKHSPIHANIRTFCGLPNQEKLRVCLHFPLSLFSPLLSRPLATPFLFFIYPFPSWHYLASFLSPIHVYLSGGSIFILLLSFCFLHLLNLWTLFHHPLLLFPSLPGFVLLVVFSHFPSGSHLTRSSL